MKFLKLFFKWLGLAILALALLLLSYFLGIFGWQKWTGIQNWKQAQSELRAQGEKLTFAELVTAKPVPDSENFYGDPLWKDVWDAAAAKPTTVKDPNLESHKLQWAIKRWETPLSINELAQLNALFPSSNYPASLKRRDAALRLETSLNSPTGENKEQTARLLLEISTPAEPILNRLAELIKRPASYLPLHYVAGVNMALPHVPPILSLGRLLGAKAAAELTLGNTQASATDIETLLQLTDVLKEPILITLVVREALLKATLETLNRGIAIHAWSDEQLRNFQVLLTGKDFIHSRSVAYSGERACVDESSLLNISEMDGLSEKQSPVVTWAQFFNEEGEKAFYDLWIQQFINLLRNQPKEGLNAKTLPPLVVASDKPKTLKEITYQLKKLAVLFHQGPLRGGIKRTTETQTAVNQSLIACALERYRLAHGSYPSSLDALVPEYLAAIAKELTTGEPMHYRLLDDGRFLLWSVGWNLQTLNGKPGEYVGEGDIVWNDPVGNKERTKPVSR